MNVYHTSTLQITDPDISHSRDGLDFGRGFYCTILYEQAEAYGLKFSLRGAKAILNEYTLDPAYTQANIKQFKTYDEEWLDFIMANRRGEPTPDYDIIEGGVADDKIFRTIDLFISGDISKADALRRLKYEKPNHQICFRTQEAIDRYLHFKSSKEL